MSDVIQPFRIETPDTVIDDLKRRLRDARWPERECVDDWSQGIPLEYLKDVCAYWAEKYDWRDREARLNEHPQFRTEIDGLGIHFTHIRSPNPDAMPLLITHGWPGSVVEFLKVIGPLSRPRGTRRRRPRTPFTWSAPRFPATGSRTSPTSRAGAWRHRSPIGLARTELMQPAWGTTRYAAQGGDWGCHGHVTRIGHPGSGALRWASTSTCPSRRRRPTAMSGPHRVREVRARGAWQHYDRSGTRATRRSRAPDRRRWATAWWIRRRVKPAWILEKFWAWTDCDGHPENALTPGRAARQRHAVLAAGEQAASSARLYWESFRNTRWMEVTVPTGCSIFPKEIFRSFEALGREERFKNLVHFNELEKGGHFAAFEQPETFVAEVRACFRGLR